MSDADPIKDLVEKEVRAILSEMSEQGPTEKKQSAAAIESLMRVISGGELGDDMDGLKGLLEELRADSAPRPRPIGPGQETNQED